MVLFEMKNIKKSFGSLEVLKDISLQVEEGEVLSIIGPSGSGKSTLLRCATGLETPDSGEIIKQGDVGLVFQNFNLFPHFSVLKNITDAPIRVQKRKKEEVYAQARTLLKQMGLADRENAYPFQLSGGQRQRVMIAMALVCKPEILIADEPTTALDVTIQAQILDLMNQLKKETGTSILFITHDLGVVAEVCDDVAVMYCGRVVERGDVKTIFANPSHPYTKGLLGSIPRLGDAGKELKSIPGNVPNPKYMPKGCKFEPRCPYASEKCREEEPGFFQIEEGHISRCWLCESGQLKTDHVEKAGD